MKITTIWWGNWQSNLLDWMNKAFWDKIEISSIVLIVSLAYICLLLEI